MEKHFNDEQGAAIFLRSGIIKIRSVYLKTNIFSYNTHNLFFTGILRIKTRWAKFLKKGVNNDG